MHKIVLTAVLKNGEKLEKTNAQEESRTKSSQKGFHHMLV